MFVHLHTHSCFSFCRGASRLEDIVSVAKALDMPAIALTDTNGLYGLVWFLQTAEDAGVRPIIGVEIRTAEGRAVLLAKNLSGYRSVCRAVTSRHMNPSFRLREQLLEDREGCIILSSDRELLHTLASQNGTTDLGVEVATGPDRFTLVEWARRSGLPPVATNDVHFAYPDDFEVHRLLRAIDLNTTRDRISPDELCSPDAWMKSEREMRAAFPDCPQAIDNTLRVADRCQLNLSLGTAVFPGFETPTGEDVFSYLETMCYKGAERRYGELSEALVARLDYELGIIRDKGFAEYFLVVEDIVRQSPRTCGRGSAAASLVSYCLGITHVDPVRHNLFFERFLNRGRTDPPDIDVDFAWDERDGVLQYVFDKYGTSRSAMIANHVAFRARAAVREIAKVYGLPESEIATVADRLARTWRFEKAAGAVDEHPIFKNLSLREPWPEILELSQKIEGLPRHLSVHCGGVVVVPDALTDYVASEPAPKGVNIIHWEKDQAEDFGLVKMDLLGNRSLAVIRDALAAVERNYGVVIDYAHWNPIDDPKTCSLMARGDTMGVFYVESPAMRQLQKKTEKGDYEHLVIHSSIIRPAANNFIREYVRRLRGEPYDSLHPILDAVLAETYGIMVYQEDVARVAIAMAGFDAADADLLRKILTKKRVGRKLDDFRVQFHKGAAERGVERATVEKVWDMILSFSGYSFCKPHSASYALVSYKSCYLRAHYPAELMAAVLSNQGGYYTVFAYVSEARRMGLEVLPPDINASDKAYRGVHRKIRLGLMQIKGLGEIARETVIDERERGGPFRSFDAFLRRVDIDPSHVRLLIRAGAFDSIAAGASRPQLLWRLAEWKHGRSRSRLGSLPLFREEVTEPPEALEYDERTVLLHEVETLGFLLSRHPLVLYRERFKGLRIVSGNEMDRHVGGEVQMIGWWVTGKMILTKNEEPMEFVSFEDTTAIYEATFFPRTYARFCHMLSRQRPYLLRGRVEEDFGAVQLVVDDVRLL
jgi:error-prone DNA polymerase